MTFLAFRLFSRRKHRNDVIVTSYIKILQILKLKSKDITSKTLHAKFYASRIQNKRIRRGVKYAPQVWSVFKSPGKTGLTTVLENQGDSNVEMSVVFCRLYCVFLALCLYHAVHLLKNEYHIILLITERKVHMRKCLF